MEFYKQIEAIELNNKTDFNILIIALEGISEGYPKCCIIQFCKDLSQGLKPFELRGLKDDRYVPCDNCD